MYKKNLREKALNSTGIMVEWKMYRVLNIRRHKYTIFLDGIDSSFEKKQLMMDVSLKRSNEIIIGDIIVIKIEAAINRRGDSIKKIVEIDDVIHQEKNLSYRSRHSINDKKIDIEFENLFNALNGGNQLRLWEYKWVFTEKIRELFLQKGFQHVYSPLFMGDRGTSTVEPYMVKSKFGKERFLNITYELELKKVFYITLRPVFEIGILSRDVYSTQNGVNEFLSLEFVAPMYFCDFKQICYEIIDLAIKTAKEKNINYSTEFENVLISAEERENDNDKNVMYLNLLTTSPLTKANANGVRYEFKWKYRKKTIAHGYCDENNLSNLKKFFCKQSAQLRENGIHANLNKDYIRILSLSSPPSISFNFGIDRFLQYFLNCDTAYEINNVLGV